MSKLQFWLVKSCQVLNYHFGMIIFPSEKGPAPSNEFTGSTCPPYIQQLAKLVQPTYLSTYLDLSQIDCPLVMTNSSPWLSHGPNRNRCFTYINSMVDLSSSRTVNVITCHNQMVNIPICSAKKHHKITIFLVDQPIQNGPHGWSPTAPRCFQRSANPDTYRGRESGRVQPAKWSFFVFLTKIKVFVWGFTRRIPIFWFSDGFFSISWDDFRNVMEIFHGIWLAKLV